MTAKRQPGAVAGHRPGHGKWRVTVPRGKLDVTAGYCKKPVTCASPQSRAGHPDRGPGPGTRVAIGPAQDADAVG